MTSKPVDTECNDDMGEVEYGNKRRKTLYSHCKPRLSMEKCQVYSATMDGKCLKHGKKKCPVCRVRKLIAENCISDEYHMWNSVLLNLKERREKV